MRWYDWHTITERLQARAYALTRGQNYKVSLDANIETGYCDFHNKEIHINPNLFREELRNAGLPEEKLPQAGYMISRAIVGHEALHVLYSNSSAVRESQDNRMLKILFNILEDARIETIGSSQSYVSKVLFLFLNKVASNVLNEFKDKSLKHPTSILDLLLRWRLCAATPKLTKKAMALWSKVLELADKSIYSADSVQTLDYAKQILALIPEQVNDATDEINQELEKSGNTSLPEEGLESSKPNPINNDSEASTISSDNATDDTQSESKDDDITSLLDKAVQTTNDTIEDVIQDDDKLIAESKPQGRKLLPHIYASQYKHFIPQVQKIAAELIRNLKVESPKAINGSSDTPGRFKTRLFIRDETKPYQKTVNKGLKTPKMALSLVLDRSESMQSVIDELKIASIAIIIACEQLNIPLSIWSLEGQVHIKRFDETGSQVLAKIAGLEAQTLTVTLPTLTDAEKELKKRPEELKHMIFIHDGAPTDLSDFFEWRKLISGFKFFCLFIIPDLPPDEIREILETARERMDALIGKQNYALSKIEDIYKNWCVYIRHSRRRL